MTGRQRPEGLKVESEAGAARLPGGNAQGRSCSEYCLYPAAAISLDTWLLRGVKAAGGTAGALATTFKAFVRAVGHGLPGANGFCLLLPSERRVGRQRRPCSCPGPVPTPCCTAAPRQVGPTWAFQMPSNGHRALAPAGRVRQQPCSTCLPIWDISVTSTSIQAVAPLPWDEGLGVCSLPCHLPGKGPVGWTLCRRDPPLVMDPQSAQIHPDPVMSALLASVFLLVKWENGTTHPGSLAASVRKQNTEGLATWSPVALGLIRKGRVRESDVAWE